MSASLQPLQDKCRQDKYICILIPFMVMLADYAAVLLAEETAFRLRNLLMLQRGEMHISWLNFYVLCPLLYLAILYIEKLYSRKMQSWRMIASVFKAVIYAVLLIVLLMYVAQIAASISRLYIGFLCIFSFLYIVLFRYVVKKILDKTGFYGEPVLLIGAGKTAELIFRFVQEDVWQSYHLIGFLEDNDPNETIASQIPHLGQFSDAAEVILKTGVRKILVAAPGLRQKEIESIIYDLQPLVNQISFIPDMGKLPISTMDMEPLIDGHMVILNMRNNLKNKRNRLLKLGFDWILTLVGTICILPALLAIALWVYHDSPGPILFKHRRVGRGGKAFDCYKFRSMCVDADVKLQELLEQDPAAREEWERDFKLKDDPRITRSGSFLRRTSLDELPQIFNVLKGEMSLVGPRPIIQEEVPRYGKYIENYYMVRPGITGIWQTSGRSDVDYDERVQMDSWYVRNWNIWFDIVLLWRTFSVVVNKKGAY